MSTEEKLKEVPQTEEVADTTTQTPEMDDVIKTVDEVAGEIKDEVFNTLAQQFVTKDDLKKAITDGFRAYNKSVIKATGVKPTPTVEPKKEPETPKTILQQNADWLGSFGEE